MAFLLERLNYVLFGRRPQQEEVIPEDQELPKKKKTNRNRRRKNRNKNKNKISDTCETEEESSGQFRSVVEEVKEDIKSKEQIVIKVLPEPSSEEGWTDVPEVVKKKKNKKNNKDKQNAIKKPKEQKDSDKKEETKQSTSENPEEQSQEAMKSTQSVDANYKKKSKAKNNKRNRRRLLEKTIVKKVVLDLIDSSVSNASRECSERSEPFNYEANITERAHHDYPKVTMSDIND